MFTSSTASHPI
uniref:Uncharacterized protein n=1 Tax=Anguilla anguilla TaxID=7936 RepID=A0A0E9U316_ANGAN